MLKIHTRNNIISAGDASDNLHQRLQIYKELTQDEQFLQLSACKLFSIQGMKLQY